MAETLGRRAFLAGAGALAAAPLLPALPVGAGETVGGTAVTITKTIDLAWAGSGRIAGSTYYVWMIRNASGVLDMMASRDKNPTLPAGYKIVHSPFAKRTRKPS